jgi:hypothetical protein
MRDAQFYRRRNQALKQDRRYRILATIVVGPNDSIWASDDKLLVWFLPAGEVGTPGQAYCRAVLAEEGMPVEIEFIDGVPLGVVVGIDPFMVGQDQSGSPRLAKHHFDHQVGGRDMVWVDPRAFMPLAIYPSTIGLKINVVAGYYEDASGERQYFNGYLNKDISASQPTGPDEHLLVGIYIDTGGLLATVDGATVATGVAVPEPIWPAGAVRLAVVDLNDIQTTISLAGDVEDRRLFLPYPGGGNTVKVSSNDTTADYLLNKLVAGSTGNVTLTEMDDGGNETLEIDAGLKNNFTAVSDPTINDDEGDGYARGSLWINTSLSKIFICIYSAVGGALWVRTAGWPYLASVPTVDSVLLNADYSEPNLAVSGESTAGKTILAGSETWSGVLFGTLSAGVHLVGFGKNQTLLRQITNIDGLSVAGTSIVSDATFDLDLSNADDIYAAILVNVSDGPELRRLKVMADGGSGSVCNAIHIAYDCTLTDVETVADGVGVNVVNNAIVTIRRGNIDSLAIATGCTVHLDGPTIGAISGTGWDGEYKNTDGLIIARDTVIGARFDREIIDLAGAGGVASHFRTTGASYPAGWTEVDAPLSTNVNTTIKSAWYIAGNSSNTAWVYKQKSLINLENVSWPSFQYVIEWRDGRYSADLQYRFGLYRNNAGAIDTNTYVRFYLKWDSAASLWKIQGEEKDGSTAHTGTVYSLAAIPVQPLVIRLNIQNVASKPVRVYVGYSEDAQSQSLIFSQSPSSAPTWGLIWLQHELSTRGAGAEDYLMIHKIDYLGDLA